MMTSFKYVHGDDEFCIQWHMVVPDKSGSKEMETCKHVCL